MRLSAAGLGQQLGDDHVYHEVSTRFEVSGGVGENPQLFVLGRDVHDGVRHHMHELERAGNTAVGRNRRCRAQLEQPALTSGEQTANRAPAEPVLRHRHPHVLQ